MCGSSVDFWQKCQDNSMEKGWSFQQMMLQTSGYPYAKQNWGQNSKNTSNPYLASCSIINSKWVINLNVRAKLYNSQKTAWIFLHDLGLGDDVLDMTLKAQVTIKRRTGIHQSLKCLLFKRHHQESEKTI